VKWEDVKVSKRKPEVNSAQYEGSSAKPRGLYAYDGSSLIALAANCALEVEASTDRIYVSLQ
jgi:hypothetical protein